MKEDKKMTVILS